MKEEALAFMKITKRIEIYEIFGMLWSSNVREAVLSFSLFPNLEKNDKFTVLNDGIFFEIMWLGGNTNVHKGAREHEHKNIIETTCSNKPSILCQVSLIFFFCKIAVHKILAKYLPQLCSAITLANINGFLFFLLFS